MLSLSSFHSSLKLHSSIQGKRDVLNLHSRREINDRFQFFHSNRKSMMTFARSEKSSLSEKEMDDEFSHFKQLEPSISSQLFHACAVTVFSVFIALSDPMMQYALAEPVGPLCDLALSSIPSELLPSSSESLPPQMIGMSMKNFDVTRYVGRWYEILSIKKGFAGQGQEDCHCTQGVYSFNPTAVTVEVDTFCVHGSPSGYLTGIKGSVSCVPEENLESLESSLEKQQMIREKCFLRFPSIPFIPKSVYDVIDTDYDNYAIVSGSKDTSFVQVYSRIPNPGDEFIDFQKQRLGSLGYKVSDIRETPQDCPIIPTKTLQEMMSPVKMQQALENVLPGRVQEKSELELVLEGKAQESLGESLWNRFKRNVFGL